MVRAAIILTLLLVAGTAWAEPSRIVAAGAAVTEIAVALGLAPRIVAVDTSGRELPEMRDKPDIGYVRTLGAEGILSQKPDLFIASADAGPAPVIEQVRSAGVEVVVVPSGRSLDNIGDKIRTVAKATGCSAKGEELVLQVESEMKALRAAAADGNGARPGVVFLLARHGGSLMAAGRDTAAHAMIEASGGRNACADFTGYKPLSPEIFAAAAPEFVIVSQSVGGSDAELLSRVPGLDATPAGRNLRIIRVDDTAFLGFGPRAPATAGQVAARLLRP